MHAINQLLSIHQYKGLKHDIKPYYFCCSKYVNIIILRVLVSSEKCMILNMFKNNNNNKFQKHTP